MFTLEDMFIKPLQVDINKIISEAVELNSDEIVQLNQSRLKIGEDSAGGDLGQYANYSYKNRWKPVDLFLTGDFWRGMVAAPDLNNESFSISSTDEKTEILVKKYGIEILGVHKDDIEQVQNIIVPAMQDSYRRDVLYNRP